MVALREIVNARALSDVSRQILAIIAITILIETLGALLIFLFLPAGGDSVLLRIK